MNWFAVMGVALVAIAAALWAAVLRTFGFWRWLKYQWLDGKAYLFDAETDDYDPFGWSPEMPTDPPPTCPEPPPTPRPKRKRRPKT